MNPAKLKALAGKKIVVSTKDYVVYAGKLVKVPEESTGSLELANAWSSKNPALQETLSIPMENVSRYQPYVDSHPYETPYYTPKR